MTSQIKNNFLQTSQNERASSKMSKYQKPVYQSIQNLQINTKLMGSKEDVRPQTTKNDLFLKQQNYAKLKHNFDNFQLSNQKMKLQQMFKQKDSNKTDQLYLINNYQSQFHTEKKKKINQTQEHTYSSIKKDKFDSYNKKFQLQVQNQISSLLSTYESPSKHNQTQKSQKKDLMKENYQTPKQQIYQIDLSNVQKDENDQLSISQIKKTLYKPSNQKFQECKNLIQKNDIFYISKIQEAYKNDCESSDKIINHFEIIFNQVKNSIYQSLPHENEVKKLNLIQNEKYKGKKTIIFDLDETLVHCGLDVAQTPYDLQLGIKHPNGQSFQIGLNVRQYAIKLIQNLSKYFELIIFTASQAFYANEVILKLDPYKKYISHCLYRDSCNQTQEGTYIKDLRIINRKLEDMLIVDNYAVSFAFNINNGVPIINFYDDKSDQELIFLERYLMTLLDQKDVRDSIKNTFRLEKIQKFNNPQDFINQVFN